VANFTYLFSSFLFAGTSLFNIFIVHRVLLLQQLEQLVIINAWYILSQADVDGRDCMARPWRAQSNVWAAVTTAHSIPEVLWARHGELSACTAAACQSWNSVSIDQRQRTSQQTAAVSDCKLLEMVTTSGGSRGWWRYTAVYIPPSACQRNTDWLYIYLQFCQV